MSFRITGLSPEPFRPLFSMTDHELAAHRAVRRVAETRPGYPCRVSLTDPEQLRLRLLSVRAFDRAGMMVGADVVDGKQLEALVARLLDDERAGYLHVHFARQGCYAARIERA